MELGRYNTLEVIKHVDFGIYLDGGEYGNILVPKRYVETIPLIGDQMSVFIYRDSEDRLIGTTETPLATVGDFAYLKVTGISNAGAFLDWGLMKDVLVPHREQPVKMKEGESYVVFIYIDPATHRIVASAKTNKFLSDELPEYKRFEEVDVIIEGITPLGYKCIVDNNYRGLLYQNQVFRPLSVGEQLVAYVDRVRPDKKIDLLIEKPGLTKVEEAAEKIIEQLGSNEGFIAVGDHSSPEEIQERFNTSKKTFKKAVGLLFKAKRITVEKDGLKLVK